ncbi:MULTISPECIES: hypothetical protein [unclassified Rhodococcus (in: high G+C Gram-positive bacteria)]|uniref:hypothetical protein n=1 Tax=unclassified Rhodococcus (in: high G+C Gram-positive bacteria) TaxID=192944 RepID=UPI000BD10445|nr:MULTISPECIES: hypothetical protein [unclassified Rhodococcus (in: high G+C Gram-positive bacteria)]MBP1162323.1 hypothetical protein [Rhodococcus sp. PvR099]PTR45036.1 hypothetical protein C8K38_102176 [Rhodococcus sp. OK611]SNX89371.1 hypothetical protein SAMN05447004_102176 [Rhodococcus sp. OK270]
MIDTAQRVGTDRARIAAAALFGVAGVLFLLYPAVRPYSDYLNQATMDGARAYASGAWVSAHFFGMIGFLLLGLAVQALREILRGTEGDRAGIAATVLTWVGVGLTLPYYGAEDFGLHAIGGRAVADGTPELLDLVDGVRGGGTQMTMFTVGLLLVAAGAVAAAVGIWRSGVLARWSGVPLAVGFALFIPQFFGSPWMRVAHGVLVAAGALWLAAELLRARRVSG